MLDVVKAELDRLRGKVSLGTVEPTFAGAERDRAGSLMDSHGHYTKASCLTQFWLKR